MVIVSVTIGSDWNFFQVQSSLVSVQVDCFDQSRSFSCSVECYKFWNFLCADSEFETGLSK
jgi:hypothetical protein